MQDMAARIASRERKPQCQSETSALNLGKNINRSGPTGYFVAQGRLAQKALRGAAWLTECNKC
jgi:hypothetical protein